MGNKVFLIGRLGKDPEVKEYGDNKTMCKFSLATDDGWGENKHTNWHLIKVWGKQAELCARYLSKGRQVKVEGRIERAQ